MPGNFKDRKSFVAYCQNNSLGLSEALEVLTQHVQPEVTYDFDDGPASMVNEFDGLAHALKDKNESVVSRASRERREEEGHATAPQNQTTAETLPGDIKKVVNRPHTPALFIAGGKALKETITQMHETGRYRALTSVQFAQSSPEAIGLDEKLPEGYIHRATILHPVKPITLIHYLKQYMGCTIRLAHNIIDHPENHLFSGYKEYLAQLTEVAREHAFEVRTVTTNDPKTVQQLMKRYSSARNAFFSIAHLVPFELLATIVATGKVEEVMTLAPSLKQGGTSPLSLGINTNILDDLSIPYKKVHETLYVREVPADELYVHGANVKMLTQLGYQDAHDKVMLEAHKIVLTDD